MLEDARFQMGLLITPRLNAGHVYQYFFFQNLKGAMKPVVLSMCFALISEGAEEGRGSLGWKFRPGVL